MNQLLDIYNSFIRAYRQANNAPYRARKNYESLPQDIKNKVERIRIFFESNSNLNMDEFFQSPYFLFSDTKYFPFDYFLSRKAIRNYTDYQKELLMLGPDDSRNLIKIKNSAIFLKKFLKEESLKFSEYLNHQKEKIPSFITHLKNRNMSIYFLLGVEGFESCFYAFDSNLAKFIIPDIYENFELYNKKFLTSKHARLFVKNILTQKIDG